MRTMKFQSPEFHHGANVTVRKGSQWADLVPGDPLRLVPTEAGAASPKDAVVLGVQLFGGPGSIPDSLARELVRIYGPGVIGSPVTVVVFAV
jgi:hypothetical protein